jgi:hypothetical protein
MLIPLGFLAASGAGGVASDYELINTTVLTSNATSVTFSGLDAYSTTYKHLQIRMLARHSASDNGVPLQLLVNGVSADRAHRMFGDRSAIASQYNSAGNQGVYATGAGVSTDLFAANIVDFTDAYSTNKNKTVKSMYGWADGGTTVGDKNVIALASLLRISTAALTSLSISVGFGNIIPNSRFSLYGIKG